MNAPGTTSARPAARHAPTRRDPHATATAAPAPARGEPAVLADLRREVRDRNPGEDDFHRAVHAVLDSLAPLIERRPGYGRGGLLQRLLEPERQVIFRVPWTDDAGEVRVNRGYRVQFSSALGPHKGGIRFHPSMSLGTAKFLGFEQTLKNALTGMRIGAGKGGADFDPRGRSEGEVMRFCQSFMTELWRHVGEGIDVPAGDAGVGEREIGFLLGQYMRLAGGHPSGAITGKPLDAGGAPMRREATGYGLVAFVERVLAEDGDDLHGARVVVSGAGNVAVHAVARAARAGARCVACSDSHGVVVDEDGLDADLLAQVKLEDGGDLRDYAARRDRARHHEDGRIWDVPCDIALPCATQNELDGDGARALAGNGCRLVAEGANMPVTPAAARALAQAGVRRVPGKAANAGGVVASVLEMRGDAAGAPVPADRAEAAIEDAMADIHDRCLRTAEEYGRPGDHVAGADIAGVTRVADAIGRLGVV